MSIRFRCPKCGKMFEVGDEHGGRRAQCRACGAMMEIPPALAPTRSARAPQPAPPSAPQPAPPSAPQPAPPPVLQPAPPRAQAAPRPGPPAAAQPAPYAPRGDEPVTAGPLENGPVIAGCLLLLLTIVVPWAVVARTPVWSWDVLEVAPLGLQTFVIGEWIVAGVLVVLAFILSGMVFSIAQTGLSLLGVFLMLGMIGTRPPWGAAAEGLDMAGEGALPVEVLALLSVFALYVLASLRLRIGRNVVMNLLLGVSASLCVALMLFVFVPSVIGFLDLVDRLTLKVVVSSPMAILGGGLIAQAFVILAAVLALINAFGVGGEAVGYAQAAVNLIRAALGVMLVLIVLFSGIVMGHPQGSLAAAIGLVLILAMPLLLLSGVIRLIGDVMVGARRALRS